MMKKILVTGASGFIGRKTAQFFCGKGYDVRGWNRNVNMMDEDAVARALSEYRPDCIVHCAGSADVGKSVKNPFADFESNVTITHNILFAMHKLDLVKTRFIFLSSASVYGNPIALPITEDMPLNPLSPYAVHKVMCEDLCMYFVKNYNMDIKIARIFSAYGEGLKKQIFWDMYNKYKKTNHLEMFGTGEESRDYIHVDDVVQALYLLSSTDDCNTIYNVANGIEITIKEVTEMFAESMGAKKEVIEFNGITREGEPLNWKADISRLKNIGYTRSVEMQRGLNSYCAWVQNYGDLR